MFWPMACLCKRGHARESTEIFKTRRANRVLSFLFAPCQPGVRQQFQDFAGPSSVALESFE